MALTPSTMMLPLGTPAPHFVLPDPSGRRASLDDFRDARALLVVFMCNHCPYVKHIRGALAQFAREYQPKGLAMVGINSNDAAKYPDDSPQKMAEEIKADAQTKARERLVRAEAEIDGERAKAQKGLHEDLARMAVRGAENILRRKLEDAAEQHRLVAEFIADAKDLH